MLNHQFAKGFPSNDLAEAGVLIRQLDSLDDTDKPWLPCPLTGYNNWCAHFNDRWATSVINNDARVMYYDVLKDMARGGVGGLVLSPRVTIFCAYADDGNSMDNQKVCKPAHGDGHTCIPGCYRDGEQCADMNRDWLCSYPPSQLKNALQKHLDRGATKNNEIVVDTRSITSAPTEMIVALRCEREHRRGAQSGGQCARGIPARVPMAAAGTAAAYTAAGSEVWWEGTLYGVQLVTVSRPELPNQKREERFRNISFGSVQHSVARAAVRPCPPRHTTSSTRRI